MQLRNVAVINAAKQIKTDPEATKKREELNKRIEETRRKLQSVSHNSICLLYLFALDFHIK